MATRKGFRDGKNSAGLLLAAGVSLFVSAQVVAQEEEPAATAPPAAATTPPAAGTTTPPAAPGSQQPQPLPPLGAEIMTLIGQATTCIDEEEDIECAKDRVGRAERIRNLNNHEQSLLWNLQAYIAFQEDDTPGAIAAYERIKELPIAEMPPGLVSAAWRNLSSLYLEQEEYQKGLDGYIDWMELPFTQVTGKDWFFLSQMYLMVDDFPNGLDAVNEAIDMARAEGSLGEENWWAMRYYFLFQLERIDDAIENMVVLVENWTKDSWVMQLAGLLQEQERFLEVLALYEAAYGMGWLDTTTEQVQLASLYMNNDMAFKAANVLSTGLESGSIESTHQNWRMLGQAWQTARDDLRAVEAWRRASELAEDGDIDRMLSMSLGRLGRWEECADSAQSALDRGGINRPDFVYMQLGRCQLQLRKYSEARAAFEEARKDDRQTDAADDFLTFIRVELERIRRNEADVEAARQM